MPGNRPIVRVLAALCFLLPLLVPSTARAWWNDAWKQRTVITLNTSSAACRCRAPDKRRDSGAAALRKL